MKFNCGETDSERRARQSTWHRWFAWRPVRVASHDCRWLEWVERRFVHWETPEGYITISLFPPYDIEYRVLEERK